MYAIRKEITTTAYMLQLRKAKLIGMKGSSLTSKIKKDIKSGASQMVSQETRSFVSLIIVQTKSLLSQTEKISMSSGSVILWDHLVCHC